MFVMDNHTFVKKAKRIADNVLNKYALGMWGNPLTPERIANKASQLSKSGFYTSAKIKELEDYGKQGARGFDCVCFIKSILWGFDYYPVTGYTTPSDYGSHGVADFGADSLKQYSTEYSESWVKEPEIGEILWMKGHVGIYIGDAICVESTNAWESKIQYTNVLNLPGERKCEHSRLWIGHGKLKYIEYKEEKELTEKEVRELVNRILDDRIMDLTPRTYHYFAELPDYAQKPIMALYTNGYLAGRSIADLDLSDDLLRALVVVAKVLKTQNIIDY